MSQSSPAERIVGITTGLVSFDANCPEKLEIDPQKTSMEVAEAVGAHAVLLKPPSGLYEINSIAELADYAGVERLDEIWLPGGPDVNPMRYMKEGEKVHKKVYDVNDQRDEFEIAVVRACKDDEVPVIAYCRGLQIANVALKGEGSLHQHWPDVAQGNNSVFVAHRNDANPKQDAHHDVLVTEEIAEELGLLNGASLSNVFSLDGKKLIRVNLPSRHHQTLDRLSDDLVDVGWAEDGAVELVISRNRKWSFRGYQAHPELAFSRYPEVFRAAQAQNLGNFAVAGL